MQSEASAKVYVYEVVTETTTFQTASQLDPTAFIAYNGGKDVVYKLIILATYAKKEMSKAIEDYNLGKNNVKMLEHKPITNELPRRPFYWWR